VYRPGFLLQILHRRPLQYLATTFSTSLLRSTAEIRPVMPHQ
jgi:hypothetical protein